ncbi:MAG: sarcosine oxidase subunit gamma family protein [Gammaproteobacteria bacterium]|nr:sarcosine oxidase subunit gamma family protein [Gammaproteobacteria bacterium]
MPDSPRAESPLNQVSLAELPDAAVTLVEIPFQGLVNLRGRPDDAEFMAAVAGVLGIEPPQGPNTVARAGEATLFWLAPDEWLVMTPPGRQEALVDALEAALEGQFSSVVEVTGYYTTVAVGGPRAADLLAKGCTLDLHPSVLGYGRCAQTLLAKATVLLWPVDETPPAYRLLVRRSFADYLGRWLNDAVREFETAAVSVSS